MDSTKSKQAATRNLDRAAYFAVLHERGTKNRGRGTPSKEERELPRGALVFAIAALDAYLSDVSAEVLVARLGRRQGDQHRAVLKQIVRDLPSLALELAVAEGSQESRLDYLREEVRKHFQQRQTNFGPGAVTDTVTRIGGDAESVWGSVGSALKREPKAVKKDLEDWTERRHRIVHSGEAVRVNRAGAQRCIDSIRAIVGAADAVATREVSGGSRLLVAKGTAANS